MTHSVASIPHNSVLHVSESHSLINMMTASPANLCEEINEDLMQKNMIIINNDFNVSFCSHSALNTDVIDIPQRTWTCLKS